MPKEKKKKVFLDTSYLIRLLDTTDKDYLSAVKYFEHFRSEDAAFYLSTIVISEYLIKGSESDLPLRISRISPFSYIDAKEAAVLFAKIKQLTTSSIERTRGAIKDDVKILAQIKSMKADVVLTADNDFSTIVKKSGIAVEVINILEKDYWEYTGTLKL